MKITVLGAGTSIVRPGYSNPSFLIELTRGPVILVDCGGQTLGQLTQLQFDPGRIDHIFITHPDADHMGGLMPLLLQLFNQSIPIYARELQLGRIAAYLKPRSFKKTLYLHGFPPDEKTAGFRERYKTMRQIFRLPAGVDPYPVKVLEHRNSRKQYPGFFLETRLVTHNPEKSTAIGLRLEAEGFAVMFSGDSGDDPALVHIARKADLAFIECGVFLGQLKTMGTWPFHLSAHEVGHIAKRARLKHLVIVHEYGVETKHRVISAVKTHFTGEVTYAKDFMTFTLKEKAGSGRQLEL